MRGFEHLPASMHDCRRLCRTWPALPYGPAARWCVDILTAIPGVEFDAAWPRCVEDIVDTATGLKATFISRDDLIAAKLAGGRDQDLADVEAIRKAAESQRPVSKKKAQPTDRT
jgi:hypothetical protein